MANKTQAPQPPEASPIEVVAQEFLGIDLHATPADEFETGTLDVDRKFFPMEEASRRWVVLMTVEIGGEEEHKAPPYVGSILARGIYEVHPDYPGDPERLIRITGSSMLYGAVREMLATFTARGPNGLVTLPSVSFFEEPEKPTPKPKPAKKKAAGKK
jgi:hypothetical protein